MKHWKKLRSDFVILFVFLFVSCAKVPIKDSEWCGDIGEDGAACFNTLSDKSRDISKKDWDKERFGMICTKPQTFSDWEASIIKLCKVSKRCTFESKKIIIKFMRNVEEINQLSSEGASFDIK